MSQEQVISVLKKHSCLDAGEIARLCSANICTIRQNLRRLKRSRMIVESEYISSVDYRRVYWRLVEAGK